MQEVFWEDNNASIKYSSGKWSRAYGTIYHGSAVMRTRRLGDSMSVSFQGSAIKFMGAQGWDHGSFLVNLDGEETIVDGYCCGPNGGVPQVIQFEATGLSTTSHTLNITNSAAGPSGTVLEVDALLITPHPETKYAFKSHISLVAFFVLLAIILVAVRRRLIRLAHTTSYQMLPMTSNPPASSASTPAAPSALHRRDKGTPHPYFNESGASGSGSGTGSQTVPQYYAPPATDPQLDDALVERIAQRLARLVHEDAPPTYETTTAA
ncbi:hypothetical protein MVEN_01435300 [Mycena venus]|uniref:Uncharacterized protein n=1 Tax=Mycena venus TaxID=2733690 RepID=A0A8H6XZA4_9AGAR|nr:hypothetical protein MVEN_01435300 [Mycena venus]